MPFPPYPSVPAPSTISTRELATAPQLRSDVANAVAFLASRPFFWGAETLGATYGATADSQIALDTSFVDTWSGFNALTGSNFEWWCQAPGWYLVRAVVPWVPTSTLSARAAGIVYRTSGGSPLFLRGPQVAGGDGLRVSSQTCDLVEQVNVGAIGGASTDYIGIYGYNGQSTGQATVATTTCFPWVSLRWVAATSGTVSLPVPSNPAWPVPPAYITSAFGNANIRDTIRFLTYPPVFRMHGPSGTVASTVFPAGSVVNMGTIDTDNYSGGSTGATGGYTAPVAGNYTVYGQVNMAAFTGSTAICAGLSVAGGTTAWGDTTYSSATLSSGMGASVARRVRLTAGQKVQLMISVSSGTNPLGYNATAENDTRLVVVWDGA